MSTALCFLGLLDVLSSTPAGPSVALAECARCALYPYPSGLLATEPGEKCGLVEEFSGGRTTRR